VGLCRVLLRPSAAARAVFANNTRSAQRCGKGGLCDEGQLPWALRMWLVVCVVIRRARAATREVGEEQSRHLTLRNEKEEGEREKGIISMEINPNRRKESPSICLISDAHASTAGYSILTPMPNGRTGNENVTARQLFRGVINAKPL
jgi:hypothetical protein